jgi:hypothetical protein
MKRSLRTVIHVYILEIELGRIKVRSNLSGVVYIAWGRVPPLIPTHKI